MSRASDYLWSLKLLRLVPGLSCLPLDEISALIAAIIRGSEQSAAERARMAARRQKRGIASGMAAAESSKATEELMRGNRD